MASVRSALEANDGKWHKVTHLDIRLARDVGYLQEKFDEGPGEANTSNADVLGGGKSIWAVWRLKLGVVVVGYVIP